MLASANSLRTGGPSHAAREGREAEVADAFGCPGMLPLALFDVDWPLVTETRAVTPGVTAQQTAAPTVPYAFARSAAASLGFTFPMVPGRVPATRRYRVFFRLPKDSGSAMRT